MNQKTTRTHFPRLDVLDSILEPCVDPDFLKFVEENPEAMIAFVVLGAVECGVTKPRQWENMYCLLERAGSEYIERYIDLKMEEQK